MLKIIYKTIKSIIIGTVICIFFCSTIYSQQQLISQVLNSDLIIIGTVKSIKDKPAPETEMFHSEVTIQVDSIIKGKVDSKHIIIRLQSGAITNDTNGIDRIAVSSEPSFKIEEKLVFFLYDKDNDPYLKAANKRYKSFNNKNSITDLPNDSFWVSNYHCYEIKKGMVYYWGKNQSINNLIKNIIYIIEHYK